MSKNVRIVWHDEEFNDALALAIEKMTTAAALEIEGQAKINIVGNGQVDTGFMLNSVYTSSESLDTYMPDNHLDRVAAPPEEAPENGSVVGVAADYSLYQEVDNAFLYPAAEAVATSRGAQIVEEGKGAFNE